MSFALHWSPDLLAGFSCFFLFLAGLAAGWIDSIAGGGGLITVPVLLGYGLSPASVLATNKLQATFGSGTAAWNYARLGQADLRGSWRLIMFTFCGAAGGAFYVQTLNPALLRRIITLLLIAIAVFMLCRPRFGKQKSKPRLNRLLFDVSFGLALGFYDGFFGPGTGTFWTMAFMAGAGCELMRATGQTKLVNCASNICSLGLFIAGGQVIWWIGLLMGVGQLIGARLGSSMAVARGPALIRPIFIAVACGLGIKLLLDVYH